MLKIEISQDLVRRVGSLLKRRLCADRPNTEALVQVMSAADSRAEKKAIYVRQSMTNIRQRAVTSAVQHSCYVYRCFIVHWPRGEQQSLSASLNSTGCAENAGLENAGPWQLSDSTLKL